jgi:putative (di)nucleoside polyphosphate hydrolase
LKKEVYRSAASTLVIRPYKKDEYQILLLNKPRNRDAWQLPQGGVEEGEDTVKAALRELKEESGINNVTVIGQSAQVYRYDFPLSYRRFRPDHVKGQRIEYILTLTSSDCRVQVDNHEIVGYVWCVYDDLHRYLKRKKYLVFVQRLFHEAINRVSNV